MNARLPTTEPAAFVLDASQSLGHIAVQLPGATAVFRRLKLDFCCGGQVSLELAAEGRGLDVTELLAELGALQRPSQVLVPEEPAALIAHIFTRYHQVHRVQLPELLRMARRVEAVHRDHPQVPAGLADVLDEMEQDLLQHMQKEENVLFPMLLAGGKPYVNQPIGMMRAEHVQHGVTLERLSELTHNATPPEGACNTWRALYAGVAQLQEDLMNHIHLENNVLFARFDAPVAAAKHSPCCGSCGG